MHLKKKHEEMTVLLNIQKINMKLLKVPAFKQGPSACGPASLRMVLAYYGIKKSEKELIQTTHCNIKTGTKSKNIVAAAKKYGLDGFVKDYSSLSDLRKWYAKKVPVIIDWFDRDDGHYSPMIKIDANYIWLLDPVTAKPVKIKLKIFNFIWFDFIHTPIRTKNDFVVRRMIVIHPKEAISKK